MFKVDEETECTGARSQGEEHIQRLPLSWRYVKTLQHNNNNNIN